MTQNPAYSFPLTSPMAATLAGASLALRRGDAEQAVRAFARLLAAAPPDFLPGQWLETELGLARNALRRARTGQPRREVSLPARGGPPGEEAPQATLEAVLDRPAEVVRLPPGHPEQDLGPLLYALIWGAEVRLAGKKGNLWTAETARAALMDRGGWPLLAAPALPPGGRIVVYTVLTGGFETIKPPERQDPAARYLLFTDQPDLAIAQGSTGWEVRPLDLRGLSPRRAARLPKLLAQDYLPDHELSLYVDSSLTLRCDDIRSLAQAGLKGCDLAAYPHYARDCTYDEMDECLRLGKAQPPLTEPLRARLRAEGFGRKLGLLENAFLIRRNTPAIRRLNAEWAALYAAHDERDQFSLMYLLWKLGLPYAVLEDARNFRHSPHAAFTSHYRPPPAT